MSERKYNWDAIAAIIASLIGLLAIFVSAYTAWNGHQQTRAQVWPYLEMGESDSLPTDIIKNGVFVSHGGTLVAINSGVGPAIVRHVEVLVNGKPQPDWTHVFKALGFHSGLPHGTSSFNDKVLSPGQTLNFLLVFGQKNWVRFKPKLVSSVVIRACYCSTLGECWISTLDLRNGSPGGQPTGSCPQIPKSDEFEE
ncbi:MAG: hypothetical protein ACRES7_01715 [Gammaproteobacteria bacterium]